jgi:phosphatidate cytidylyltransferase
MRRILSAIVLILLVLTTLWWLPFWATAVLAAVAAAVAGAELAHMAARVGVVVPATFVGLSSAALSVAFVVYEGQLPGSTDDSLGAVLLALLVVAGTVALALGPPTPTSLAQAALLIMAPSYLGLPLGAIVWTHWVFGPAATTWLLGTIAVSDSAQYYTGRLFGRTKLAPAISPAKTIEGAVGGLVAAGLVGAALGPFALAGLTPLFAAFTAVALATFGIVGDLFESLLKRSAGVKDSSTMIPGHGGVLDRIDSYLFAAPVFYLLLRYLP